ncbi:MAG: hypothetical protein ACK46Y_16555 [Fluviicola sp.]
MRNFFRKNWFFLALFSLLTLLLFSNKSWDSPYHRVIIGDAKAYYAYLPAVFIYQDATFSFQEKIEKKYYPADGSLQKNYMNPLENGRKVNKTFPGLAVLYAPFFFLAWLFSAIFGFATDGYSPPFQYAIALSHIVYFVCALRLLFGILSRFELKKSTIYISLLTLTFGTNCWYYLVYDFSVGHIHAFFLVSLIAWLFINWLETKQTKFISYALLFLALLAILRPTSVLIVLFLPLLIYIKNSNLKTEFKSIFGHIKKFSFALIGVGLIFLIPLLLWKWQTGNWFVYSYSNERFYFSKPHLFEFLFSVKKGWLFWSPVIFLSLIFILIRFKKETQRVVLSTVLPILLITYIFSCWWIWTFGMGFGQRQMIEFLPFILIAFAFLFQSIKRKISFAFIFIPFIGLSILQGYQFGNFIHFGGQTTVEDYTSRFFQLNVDGPRVKLGNKYILIKKTENLIESGLSETNIYSTNCVLFVSKKTQQIKVSAEVLSLTDNPKFDLVLCNKNASYFQSFQLPKEHLSSEFSLFEYGIETKGEIEDSLILYVLNADKKSTGKIRNLKIELFSKKR